MKITLKVVTNVPAGVALRLTPEQVGAREHALEPYGKTKGVFVGTQALTFKAGESIEVVGDLPKGILPIYDKLRPADKSEPVAETLPPAEQ
jgi:hypothetical protein